jgi:hypothetical protein
MARFIRANPPDGNLQREAHSVRACAGLFFPMQ